MRQAEKVDLGSDDWTMEIRPYASAFHFPIKELWEYRDLLFLFVRRDFKTMYKQTILGPAWILLSPLLTTGMFSLIFGRIAGISTDGTPAFLFYMAGNILWNYFSSCLSAASSTFIGNAGLFGKVYFPRIVVPASSAVSKLITFGAQFLLFLILLFCSFGSGQVRITWLCLMTPVLLVMLAGIARNRHRNDPGIPDGKIPRSAGAGRIWDSAVDVCQSDCLSAFTDSRKMENTAQSEPGCVHCGMFPLWLAWKRHCFHTEPDDRVGDHPADFVCRNGDVQ